MNSNNPPSDNPADVDLDLLRKRLSEESDEIDRRSIELITGLSHVPLKIETREVAERVADFIAKQVGPAIDELDSMRTSERRAVLDIGEAVQAHFTSRMKVLLDKLTPIKQRLSEYALAHPDEELRGEYGGKVVPMRRLDIEVTDVAKIPREYLVVDLAALRQAYKDGMREIPGIKFSKPTTYSVR